jgi:hypothetical protein
LYPPRSRIRFGIDDPTLTHSAALDSPAVDRGTLLDVPEMEEELAYYREIEDYFAAMRGVPHTLSPKDFQLLRGWWRDEIPLAAVAAGISEVFARRRDRGDRDPVVSLTYCRHAVHRNAARLAEMHVGEGPVEPAAAGLEPPVQDLDSLLGRMRAAADSLSEDLPEVAAVIGEIVDRMSNAPAMPPAILEEHLFSMEAVLLDRCWRALPEPVRDAIDARSRQAADAAGGERSTRERTRRAIRDRELRERLGLPRLEIG